MSAVVFPRGGQPARGAEGWVAFIVVALIGSRIDVTYQIGIGALLGLCLMPVWWRSLVGSRPLVMWSFVALAAAASGVLLTAYPSGTVLASSSVSRTAALITVGVSVAALLWAVRMLGPRATFVAYGCGMVAGIPLVATSTDNPWRFTFSIPVIVLILGLMWGRRATLQCFVALALAMVGYLNDSRSNSTMLVLAVVLVAWHLIYTRLTPNRQPTIGLVAVIGWAALIYHLVTSAILGGYFGEATQSRTQAQIDRSGSLIVGGRPELAASWSLLSKHPLGVGPGAVPTYDDVAVAKTAMLDIGYDPENGYVERYLFGGAVEVHSVWGDWGLWFGPAGLLLVGLTVAIVLRALRDAFRLPHLNVLQAYLVFRCLWDLGFSPAQSSAPLLILALTISLIRSSDRSLVATTPEARTGGEAGSASPAPIVRNPS